MKEGKINRKLGIISVELDSAGYKISTYINNYEIENYFLKAIGFADHNEYQSLNGARFMIKKTEINGDLKIYSSNLKRNPEHQLSLQSGLSPLCPHRVGQDQQLRRRFPNWHKQG